MSVRPRVPSELPYGEALTIEARSLPTVVIEETSPTGADGFSVTFLVENGVFSTLSLEGSSHSNKGLGKRYVGQPHKPGRRTLPIRYRQRRGQAPPVLPC